jgi:hypothetical protein
VPAAPPALPVPATAPRPTRPRRTRPGLRAALLLAILTGAAVAAIELAAPGAGGAVVEQARAVLDKMNLDLGTAPTPGRELAAEPPAPAAPAHAASPPTRETEAAGRDSARERAFRSPPPPERRSLRAEPRERRRAPESRDRVTIKLITRPAGAGVVGRNGPLGRTPLTYTTRPGSTEVLRFAKSGYAPATRRITASPRTGTLVVELRRNRR